jgi:predicted short-subunit dehydrogenase-like oxidoreductase (DUF2520 family)
MALDPDRRHVVVVGAGKAGTGVGLAIAASGRDVAFVTRKPCRTVGPVPAFAPDSPGVPRGATTVILAVPDGKIGILAGVLATTGILGPDCIAGHLSGALPASVLDRAGPLAGRFSAHPMLSFPPVSARVPMPAGTTVMLEGDDAGRTEASALFRQAGAVVGTLAPERKALYHGAAVMAGNLPVSLVFLAADLLRACGVPDPLGSAARLFASAATNFAIAPGPSVVTGPFVRGDAETIGADMVAVETHDREAARAWRLLGGYLADQLRGFRTLSEKQWNEIRTRIGTGNS